MAFTLVQRSLLIAAMASLLGGVSLAQFTRTLTNNKLILTEISASDTNEVDFAVGDVDKDGDIDVIVGRKVPFTIDGPLANLLLLNDGTGELRDRTSQFTNWTTATNNTREVTIVDFNGDTWLDVVFFNSELEPTEIILNLGNDVMNNWQGFSTTPMTIGGSAGFHICGGTVLDYDNDGMMDIFRGDYSWRLFNNTNPSLVYHDDLWRQSAPGVFTDMSSLLSSGFLFSDFSARVQAHDPISGAPLDLNLDGNTPDIAIFGSTQAKACYNDGMGGFLAEQIFTENTTYDGIVYDFNQDGRPDIFKVNDVNDQLFLNTATNGDGTIVETLTSTPSGSGGFGANPILMDFNGDGNMNLWVSDNDIDIPNCNNNTTPDLYEFVVSGTNVTVNNITNQLNFSLDGVYDLAIADFDGDGLVDVLGNSCDSGSPGWFYYRSDPNSDAFRNQWAPNAQGILFEVNNIPASPNATTLYNFFDVIPTGGNTSPGAFLGLDTGVITQIYAGTVPFVVPMSPSPTTQNYNFQIPPINIVGVDMLRLLSIQLDSGAGALNISPVTSITSF